MSRSNNPIYGFPPKKLITPTRINETMAATNVKIANPFQPSINLNLKNRKNIATI